MEDNAARESTPAYSSPSLAAAAATIMQRCDLLARYSETPGCLTRRFASTEMQQVNALVADWMRAAGMSVQYDAVGNLIGRYESDQPDAKTLLLGSHLDTVLDAGRYDGILGIMVALACIEALHTRAERLPFAIELLAFADEEGLRYTYAYIGSKATVGTFDPRALLLTDTQGISLAEAIRSIGGDPDPAVLAIPRWRREDLLGYCEVHIEQGPVLEARDLPVAVVSAIAGQSRCSLAFTGYAGHAGTVPMSLRHDALCAAAEFILAVESYARTVPGMVATVGKMQVAPGAGNVIPGQVDLSLDLRHQEDALREEACRALQKLAAQISERREVVLDWQDIQASRTVFCSPALTRTMQQAIESSGYPLHTLPSGAGHDAVSISAITAVTMLFVRCRGGVSHHPDESVTVEDVAVSLDILTRFLHLL